MVIALTCHETRFHNITSTIYKANILLDTMLNTYV